MKSFLICTDEDTLLGMKFAGITGEIITDKETILKRIDEKILDPSIGIILITQVIKSIASDEIMERKMKSKKTLITEIPSKDSGYEPDFITRYIKESIGIKI